MKKTLQHALQAPPVSPVKLLTERQAAIALDLLRRIETARGKIDLYSQMAKGTTQTAVRYIDQETRLDILDVPVKHLLSLAEEDFAKQNAELGRWCGIRVVRTGDHEE